MIPSAGLTWRRMLLVGATAGIRRTLPSSSAWAQMPEGHWRPNILLIVADDLRYGK